MDDLISRQAAIDVVRERFYKYGRFAKIEELVWSIEKLPSAQPERKRGKWIYNENGIDWSLPAWTCSECHCRNDNIPTVIKFGNKYNRIADPRSWLGSNFCPNCGSYNGGTSE